MKPSDRVVMYATIATALVVVTLSTAYVLTHDDSPPYEQPAVTVTVTERPSQVTNTTAATETIAPAMTYTHTAGATAPSVFPTDNHTSDPIPIVEVTQGLIPSLPIEDLGRKAR